MTLSPLWRDLALGVLLVGAAAAATLTAVPADGGSHERARGGLHAQRLDTHGQTVRVSPQRRAAMVTLQLTDRVSSRSAVTVGRLGLRTNARPLE